MITYSVNNEAFKALTFSKEVYKMKKDIENVTGIEVSTLQELEKEVEGCSKSTPLESILESKLHVAKGTDEVTKAQYNLDTVARTLCLTVVGGKPWELFSKCLDDADKVNDLINYLNTSGEKRLALFASNKVNTYWKFSTSKAKYLAIPAE